jgi:hypothetical protein
VQALDRRHDAALEDEPVAHRLHGERSDLLLQEHRQHLMLEAPEVGVHHVERHLDGIEVDAMRPRGVEHPEMHVGVLVPGEPDVPDLARLLRLRHRLVCAAVREDAIRVLEADHLVVLQQIEVVGLQAPERLVDLPRRGLPGPAVDLGHQEDLVAVAVPERLAHADLAGAAVVVPAVVHEGDAAIDGGSDDANRLLLPRLAQVIPTEPDQRDLLAGASEGPVEHVAFPHRGARRGRRRLLGLGSRHGPRRGEARGHRRARLQEIPPARRHGAAGSQAERREPGVIVGPSSERPVKLALVRGDRQVVDAGDA